MARPTAYEDLPYDDSHATRLLLTLKAILIYWKSHYLDTDQIFAWKRIEKAYEGKAA